ncbi:MAG: helix-turn-helix domain-containing protein [Pseudonocardiaceae bacterium]
MSEDEAGEVGARVAVWRESRGLTQYVLAKRVHVSYSLLRKVECGERRASPAFLAAVARTLGVDLEVLVGGGFGEDRLLSLLGPVRTALDVFDLSPDETIRPRPLPQLESVVRRANRLAQAADYEPMAAGLPALLGELHAAAHTLTGREQERAWGLLAEAARCGHSVGIALGLNDLSVAALARMDWAAQQAGDLAPGLRSAREYLRVTAYLRAKDYETCWRLNASGDAYLAGDAPGALVAEGQLHLGASIIAAHTGDRDTMEAHLAEADRIAGVTGEQTQRFWFGFGPTNVAVHRVMALAAAGEHGQAVDAAHGLRFPADWLPTRVGHHYLDLARAWRWLNRPDEAPDCLWEARRVAPGQARRHPLARDTVTALLHTGRRRATSCSQHVAACHFR